MAEVTESDVIAGVHLVVPERFADPRGSFVETYRRAWFPGGREMVQANRADRVAGCVVGLHYHLHQADYWYVLAGRARVVLHDLRAGGPTDGATLQLDLSAEEPRGVLIPPGVAHGYASLTAVTLTYLVDGYYNPADELGLAWDDVDVAADWGVDQPVLSDRDRSNPCRRAIPERLRPTWPLRA